MYYILSLFGLFFNQLLNFHFVFQVMCVQYWPAGKNREEIYSGVGVTVENEEQLANFMIRTIRMRKVRRLQGKACQLAKCVRG